MKEHFRHVIVLGRQLLLLTALYSLCRFIFYLFNSSHFPGVGFAEFMYLLLCGLRFDACSLFILNSWFILASLAPFPFRDGRLYRKVTATLFLAINSIGLLANCVDFEYYKFTLKRMGTDVFSFMGTGGDVFHMLPKLALDYWPVVLIWITLTMLMVMVFKRVSRERSVGEVFSMKYFFIHGLIFIGGTAVTVIGARGGLQYKPIMIYNAGQYTSAENIPIVLNTPFTILKTYDVEQLNERNYFAESDLQKKIDPIHRSDTGTFRNKNVVIIILESFSKEYSGFLNHSKGYMPFLDSLMQEGIYFKNAFANGKRSFDGIPATVASIPGLMNEPYITSRYEGNTINSLAGILRRKGYYTSFFHGGTNGTMGFDAFSKIAGYADYFGRTEYNNDKDYDGSWGIWDEEFFQFFARTINTKKQPFFATFFSLSSHHPFVVPDKYKGKFPKGPLPIHQCIAYADFSLRKFFNTACKMPWYNNTLFVITADHTGLPESPFYSNNVGSFEIPLVFFCPGEPLKGQNETITQQMDIMPTVLRYLHCNEPYFSLGNNALDSTAGHYAVYFASDNYYFIENKKALVFDGEKAASLYDLGSDSLLTRNILGSEAREAEEMETRLKAIIQTYNRALISNKMTAR